MTPRKNSIFGFLFSVARVVDWGAGGGGTKRSPFTRQ